MNPFQFQLPSNSTSPPVDGTGAGGGTTPTTNIFTFQPVNPFINQTTTTTPPTSITQPSTTTTTTATAPVPAPAPTPFTFTWPPQQPQVSTVPTITNEPIPITSGLSDSPSVSELFSFLNIPPNPFTTNPTQTLDANNNDTNNANNDKQTTNGIGANETGTGKSESALNESKQEVKEVAEEAKDEEYDTDTSCEDEDGRRIGRTQKSVLPNHLSYSQFPSTTCIRIFQFLEFKTRLSIRRVNHDWHSLILDPRVSDYPLRGDLFRKIMAFDANEFVLLEPPLDPSKGEMLSPLAVRQRNVELAEATNIFHYETFKSGMDLIQSSWLVPIELFTLSCEPETLTESLDELRPIMLAFFQSSCMSRVKALHLQLHRRLLELVLDILPSTPLTHTLITLIVYTLPADENPAGIPAEQRGSLPSNFSRTVSSLTNLSTLRITHERAKLHRFAQRAKLHRFARVDLDQLAPVSGLIRKHELDMKRRKLSEDQARCVVTLTPIITGEFLADQYPEILANRKLRLYDVRYLRIHGPYINDARPFDMMLCPLELCPQLTALDISGPWKEPTDLRSNWRLRNLFWRDLYTDFRTPLKELIISETSDQSLVIHYLSLSGRALCNLDALRLQFNDPAHTMGPDAFSRYASEVISHLGNLLSKLRNVRWLELCWIRFITVDNYRLFEHCSKLEYLENVHWMNLNTSASTIRQLGGLFNHVKSMSVGLAPTRDPHQYFPIFLGMASLDSLTWLNDETYSRSFMANYIATNPHIYQPKHHQPPAFVHPDERESEDSEFE